MRAAQRAIPVQIKSP